MKLEKQNVLITGSANRIGKEIAKHLSKLGLNIAIHYNSSKKEAENTLSEIKKENVKKIAVKKKNRIVLILKIIL